MLDQDIATCDDPSQRQDNRLLGSVDTNTLDDATLLRTVRNRLYISHFLAAWNSRVFEFGAVLFLSTIFPNTLLPASIYALTRAASVILFSASVGHFIDHGERMRVVRTSIVGQRTATAVSCLLLLWMTSASALPAWAAVSSLTTLSLLACIEKLASVMNTISIERDWVVIISNGDERTLQDLNSQMRRIDLFCKLIGPLAIALIDGYSTKFAIIATVVTTCVSAGVEYFAIAKVYGSVPALRQRTERSRSSDDGRIRSTLLRAQEYCCDALNGLIFYIHHEAFLPSLSLSLLYLTVFSFGGQFITYLLSIGFTSTYIGLLRTLSTVFELSATWLAPKVMDKIGPIRGGIWFLNWQLSMVALSVIMLWAGSSKLTVIGLLVGVIMSRIGLWGFDLSAQIIVQESVEANQRGSFSALEASVQSTFELLSFASTIVFARPEQFRYPAAISAGAVMTTGILYACFVRQQRGHLFHASKCMKGRSHTKRGHWRNSGPEWQVLPQAEDEEGGEASRGDDDPLSQ